MAELMQSNSDEIYGLADGVLEVDRPGFRLVEMDVAGVIAVVRRRIEGMGEYVQIPRAARAIKGRTVTVVPHEETYPYVGRANNVWDFHEIE